MEENLSEADINPLNKQKKGVLSSDQVEPMLSYLLGDRENHHGEQVSWLERVKIAVQRFASASVRCTKVGTRVITFHFCRQTDKKIMRAGVRDNNATTTTTRQQQQRQQRR